MTRQQGHGSPLFTTRVRPDATDTIPRCPFKQTHRRPHQLPLVLEAAYFFHSAFPLFQSTGVRWRAWRSSVDGARARNSCRRWWAIPTAQTRVALSLPHDVRNNLLRCSEQQRKIFGTTKKGIKKTKKQKKYKMKKKEREGHTMLADCLSGCVRIL